MPTKARQHRPQARPDQRSHQPPATQRPSSCKRGYGRRWRERIRGPYITMHPLCEDPFGDHGGRPIPGEHVDHIVPHDGPSDPLYDDWGNLQTLCAPCHSKKTATEDGGFGNRTMSPMGDTR